MPPIKPPPAESAPGVLGDGAEERNLGQPGHPERRIRDGEVRAAFGGGDAEPTKPVEVLRAIMAAPTDLANVTRFTTPDVSYVSLNYSDPELKRVMPWAGTGSGPESIVQTFVDVARYWNVRSLQETAIFGDDRYAAVFGRMDYTSTVLGKAVTSPFCVYVEVVDGRCRFMQFMEDTFATTNSFRSGGEWLIRSNPDGEEIRV